MVKWKVSSARIQGSVHASEAIECQDFVFKYINGDIAAVTLSDGAGRAQFAMEGALCCSLEAIKNIEIRGASLFELEVENIAQIFLDNLRERLREKAASLNCSLDELACTLGFFVTNGRSYIAGNLGDGLIGEMTPNEKASVILGPERGRYVNQSYFVTGDDCYRRFRVIRGDYDLKNVYFMMTDGSCDCLFDGEKQAFAPALRTFCKWIRQYPHQAVSNSLKPAMYKLFPEKTGDDCALALVVAEKY